MPLDSVGFVALLPAPSYAEEGQSRLTLDLLALRELLSDPARWMQGASSNSLLKDPRADDATRFCLVGGVGRVTGEWDCRQWDTDALLLINRIQPNPAAFNDEHTHQEVLALLDRAIAQSLTAGKPGGETKT